MNKRLYNIIIAILLIASIVLLLDRPIKNYLLKDANENVVEQLKNTNVDEIKDNEKKEASYNFDDIKSINSIDLAKVTKNKPKVPSIGEISIPELQMNLPITKGVSNESMLVSAGTLRANQEMGVGNYTLASHYSNASNETLLFSPLKRAKTGMNIYLTNGEYIYQYELTEIFIVSPERVDVLDNTNEPIITLVTCEDLNASSRRIVRGKLVNKTHVKDASESTKNAFNIPFKTY